MSTMTTDEQIRRLGQDWVQAEQRGDTAELEKLTTGDFALVGPLGFVLDKEQWLDRYRTGALVTHTLTWNELNIRDHGEVAVVIGRQTQHAEYRGHRSDGQFRATQIVLREGGQWLLAGIHLSPITEPPTRGAAATRTP